MKHHPVPTKRTVFPAAMAILQGDCAGEKAAAKDDAGLAGPAVSAVVAPVVERTIPLFKDSRRALTEVIRWLSGPG